MQDLIRSLRDKAIHVVGATGAEGSSILRFLVKHKISNITVHDFSLENNLEKSFKLWHKGLSTSEREKLYQQFQSDLSSAKLNLGGDYLKDIRKADIIFVSQSWRLYKKENKPLFSATDKIPFYSLTRLYLDFAPSNIIAVTGTVGKGSTASIIFQLLENSGRKVYFAGNDTWMAQLADKLDEMAGNDILVLEISHRQLQDGFIRAPHVLVITNLYPNHLDEVNMETYVNLKLSLARQQKSSDIAILNYDIPQLRLSDELNSKVYYFSEKYIEMNTKSIQKIFTKLMNNKSDHYLPNLLAGYTVAEVCDLPIEKLIAILPKFTSLPARLELLRSIGGINIYDDIKSTTPWATLAGVKKLGENTILICGGRSKGIDYRDFANEIKGCIKFVVLIKSEISDVLVKLLPKDMYAEVSDITQALKEAYNRTQKDDNILISPAAGFFYRDFIRGKESLRKIITSLPPKEQV